MKLHHRIVVPFAAIPLMATAATAYVAPFVSASWSIPSPTSPVPGARAHATFPRVMALATYGFRFGSAKAPHRANTAICDETNDR